MNFLGKNLDETMVDKIKQILNSPEGQKLKQELAEIDTRELTDKLKGINLNDIDLKDIADKIDKTDKNEIIDQLKNINSEFLKNRR